jgi:3-hydroxy-9,10-secoandrosta-1,3,5(10)-triene-9,17-dione monooxygenase reductase component
MSSNFDSNEFRQVLGHYPTGVCIVTTMYEGQPTGMTVGSFTSVSLNPPLVAFFPDKKSTSWPKIAAAAEFCINILSEHQQDLCRAFSMKSETKFESVSYRMSASGLPIIDEVVAWIDCHTYAVHEAGDHYIVIGHVRSLALEQPYIPLLFYRGKYRRIEPAAQVPVTSDPSKMEAEAICPRLSRLPAALAGGRT